MSKQQSEELQRLNKERNQRLKILHSEEKIKIRALRPIRPESTGGKQTFLAGEELEVAASEAKEFCDRPLGGYSGEAGTKPTPYKQAKIFRAEYVR